MLDERLPLLLLVRVAKLEEEEEPHSCPPSEEEELSS